MHGSARSDLRVAGNDIDVSSCSWMTHLINGGVSKVDNEAMQLLKSILPDKIIARIQGVSFGQRIAVASLPHLGKHSMPHLGNNPTCTCLDDMMLIKSTKLSSSPRA